MTKAEPVSDLISTTRRRRPQLWPIREFLGSNAEALGFVVVLQHHVLFVVVRAVLEFLQQRPLCDICIPSAELLDHAASDNCAFGQVFRGRRRSHPLDLALARLRQECPSELIQNIEIVSISPRKAEVGGRRRISLCGPTSRMLSSQSRADVAHFLACHASLASWRLVRSGP